MNTYHKIQTIFKRNPETKNKTLLIGNYSTPEFEYLKDNKWAFTEKVDGTNTRIMFDGKISFGGKTDNAQMPSELVNNLHEKFLPKIEIFESFNSIEVCLYGEGFGPKIQTGGKYRDDQGFVLFDVKIGRWWLQRTDVEDVGKRFGVDVVPIVGCGTLKDLISLVEKGFCSTWGDFIAEGVVARPSTELKTRSGHRIITKLKYKDFNHDE